MNTKLFFRITAAVISLLTVFSCTKEIDEPIDKPSEPETYTLSIKASKGEFTKGLSLDDDTLNAIWDGNEEVYVFLNDELTEHIAILTPDKNAHPDPAACVLEGSFTTLPGNGDVLTLKLTSNNYSGQDGTLAFIASHCDYAVATLNVTGVNNGQIESTEGSASFINQQAIVKFTLKDKVNGTTLLSPTTLTVNDGTSDIATVTPTTPADTYSTNGDGVLYVAIPPISGKTLTLTATVGEDTYIYSRPSVSFVQGQYYTITVKLSKQRLVDLSTKTGNYEAQSGDILTDTFSDDEGYVTIPDGATVTLSDAYFMAPYDCDHAAIHCLGSANIILIGSSNDLHAGMSSNYPAVYVPSGSTLTISGSGKLTVSSKDSYHAACIGGGNGINCGNIVINGGTINASQTNIGAPGIGSGQSGSCGNITINGGSITAWGGNYAAAIGSGQNGSCGNITINGGSITAWGGNYAAAIGSGQSGSCGNISIGADITFVEARKGDNANTSNHIGKSVSGSTCGTVTVATSLNDSGENGSSRYIYP